MREGTGRPGLLQVSRSRSFPFVYHPISLPPGACAGATRRRAQDEGNQQRGAKGSVTGALWHAPHVLARSPCATARVCAPLTYVADVMVKGTYRGAEGVFLRSMGTSEPIGP